MLYRPFGNTDMMVSEIGFGAWAIGGGAIVGNTPIGWGDVDDATSIAAIYAARDAGITFFDTADIYGLGHSETILGKTIGNNQDVVMATKVGNVARDEKFTVDYSKDYILKACEASLRRLKRETIDYYQLHTARLIHLENGECVEAMQQLQKQGKIRYWGLSLNTFQPDAELEWLIQRKLGNGFQLVLNLINQKSLAAVKNAAANGYGIIARMPLQFGLLTGKFDGNTNFSVNDHRNNRLTPAIISSVMDALEPVWNLCEKYQVSKTQLALSYIKSYTQVSTIIPGIRTAEQVALNTNGLISLEPSDVQLIEHLGTTAFVPLMEKIQQQG
jgi:aryl-alcohol dehydrogenase-like predicted oxidoreductase